MGGRWRNWIPPGGILPYMEHLYEVCAWLLHVGNQQCLSVSHWFSKVCFFLTTLEEDEVVVSLMDFGVPKSICCAIVVQKLKWWLCSSCPCGSKPAQQLYFKMPLVQALLAQLAVALVPRQCQGRQQLRSGYSSSEPFLQKCGYTLHILGSPQEPKLCEAGSCIISNVTNG